jgi:Icc-related predicted phosphoesterase
MVEKKLKVLAAADVHGDADRFLALAQRAERENADLVVLCGDIFGWKKTRNLIKPFKERNKAVLVIPGNHEAFAELDEFANYYGIRNLHGSSAVYGNVAFFGAGGTDLLPGFITDKDLAQVINKAHEGIAQVEKKVLLTHMHPAGSKSEFSGFEGSLAIKEAIERFKPTLVLHGHIHEGAGLEERWGDTTIINVGREGRMLEI